MQLRGRASLVRPRQTDPTPPVARFRAANRRREGSPRMRQRRGLPPAQLRPDSLTAAFPVQFDEQNLATPPRSGAARALADRDDDGLPAVARTRGIPQLDSNPRFQRIKLPTGQARNADSKCPSRYDAKLDELRARFDIRRFPT
jgi:hypothetical protein